VVNFDYGHQEEQEKTPAAQNDRHNISAIARSIQCKKINQEKSRRQEKDLCKEKLSFQSCLHDKEVAEANNAEEGSRKEG